MIGLIRSKSLAKMDILLNGEYSWRHLSFIVLMIFHTIEEKQLLKN